MSTRLKLRICEALILSKLAYCDCIYFPALLQADVLRLKKIQNSCIRFAYGIRKYDHVTESYHDAGWLQLDKITRYHHLVLTHNVLINKMPLYLYEKFVTFSSNSNRATRNSLLFVMPKHSTALFKRSFTYNAVKMYNCLSNDYRLRNFYLSDNIMKAVYVNKEAFLCKNCVCESECSGGAGMLKKEIECLTREKSLLEKYVSELEFSNGLLKSQLSCNINKSSSAANSSTIAPPANTYAEQVKSVKMSSVLVVRSSDQNIANTDLEREMKAKVRPGSLNANVLETKLIKNGIIINCENSASLHKLKDGLQREMGNKCNVYEQKKINPKIIVYSVDKLAAQSDKLIEYIIKDNTLDAQPSDIKLVTKLNYEKSVNLILEVKPTLFKIIMNIGYLYVGWMRCSIREHFNTTFCFKCC
nr:unnamed protein product [Callosobruchus chinensis]